jgi:hypothetical protein
MKIKWPKKGVQAERESPNAATLRLFKISFLQSSSEPMP